MSLQSKVTTPVGLEPTASELPKVFIPLEVRRAIHCATESLKINSGRRDPTDCPVMNVYEWSFVNIAKAKLMIFCQKSGQPPGKFRAGTRDWTGGL